MSRKYLFEVRFFQTYYFANIIANVLDDQFSYVRGLDDFYGDDRYLDFIHPFPKYSALHCFIAFMIDAVIGEDLEEIKLDVRQDLASQFSKIDFEFGEDHPSVLPINHALNHYEIEHISFIDWLKEHGKTFEQATRDDVSDYYADFRLEGEIDAFLERSVEEVFFVVFQNRRLLLHFNAMMARQVEDTELDTLEDKHRVLFASSGVLKRVTIPKWVQRAVRYRERGLCTICHCDLSGELNISSREHFDHIIPLAQGGLNDVSNIQLLCQDCNLKKRGVEIITSDYYESWYPMAD